MAWTIAGVTVENERLGDLTKPAWVSQPVVSILRPKGSSITQAFVDGYEPPSVTLAGFVSDAAHTALEAAKGTLVSVTDNVGGSYSNVLLSAYAARPIVGSSGDYSYRVTLTLVR